MDKGSPAAGGIQVIGAGLGRTGTTSLMAALTELQLKVGQFAVASDVAHDRDVQRARACSDLTCDTCAHVGCHVSHTT